MNTDIIPWEGIGINLIANGARSLVKRPRRPHVVTPSFDQGNLSFWLSRRPIDNKKVRLQSVVGRGGGSAEAVASTLRHFSGSNALDFRRETQMLRSDGSR